MSKLIEDSFVTVVTGNFVSHEVFNPKSSHFLDFEHFNNSPITDSNDNVVATPKGLLVTSRITHGFRKTRKNAVYMPANLKLAIPSITMPYQIPVKPKHRINNELDVDPIGRAVSGTYVEHLPSQSEVRFNLSNANNLSAKTKLGLASIKDAIKTGTLFDPNFRGLGHVLVQSLITDKEAIEKILSGRLLTVSVEMSPDSWWNPATGNNWTEDDKAGIEEGDIIDGCPSIKVPGNLQFEGYAYTTHPADRHAKDLAYKTLDSADVGQWMERYKTTSVVFDNVSFDKVKRTKILDSIIEDTEGDSIMSLEELKALYIKSAKENTVFEHASDLYEGLVKKPMSKAGKLNSVAGLVIDSDTREFMASVVDQFSDINQTLFSIFDKAPEKKEEETKIEDNLTSNIDPNGAKAEFIYDSYINDLKVNKEALDKVKESLGLMSVEDHASEVSKLNDNLKSLEKFKSINDGLKELIHDSAYETMELKTSLEKAIADAALYADKLATLASVVTGKEVTLTDSSVDNLNTVKGIFDSIDMEALKTKLSDKRPLDKPIEDSNVNLDDAGKKPDTEATKYSRDEVAVAKIWDSMEQKREKIVYIDRMKRAGNVPRDFNPQIVLDSLKD
jgi:hypothetical protein